MLIAVPATVALWLLAEPILATLFQYGAFGVRDVEMAAASLRAYTLGLGGFMLIKVLAPGYYARQDMKTPVKIGIIAMVSNMVLNVVFVFPLMWYYDMGHVGLALATSASAWINAALLYRGLVKGGIDLSPIYDFKFFARLICGVVAMALVILWLAPELPAWLTGEVGWRVFWMSLLVLAGSAVYVVMLAITGLRWHMIKAP